MAEESTAGIELPIFELPLAALPTERVPLHIFEDRYQLMVAHCLEQDSPFGIVLRTDAGARSVGCAVTISEVLERFDDGRLNILVIGAWRFRVSERREGLDFPLATVRRLEDTDPALADPDAAQTAFRKLLEAVGADAEPSAGMGSAFEIGGRVEMPVEAKQKLLETDDETERLEFLCETLAELADEVERSRRIAERARGNGHAPVEGLRPPEPPEA